MKLKEVTEQIRNLALDLGFSACGFSEVKTLTEDREALLQRISKGYTANMKYLEVNLDKRSDPSKLFENTKTVISVLVSYRTPDVKIPSNYHVSKYAWGNDYHEIISALLEKLLVKIKENYPEINGHFSCDTGPVFERAWAKHAGLGWIGKNALLINPEIGSFVFLGEVFIDKELIYDLPMEEQCGSCTLCLDSCPTSAIVEPYQLDATKCITFHTIENRKDEIPVNVAENLGNRIYACDTCQDVCPYNKGLQISVNPFFIPNNYVSWKDFEWENLTEEKFEETFKSTSIKRLKYFGLKRNIELVKNKNLSQS